MEIDILSVHTEPQYHLRVSHLVDIELREFFNDMFKDVKFPHKKLIFSFSTMKDIEALTIWETFKLDRGKSLSVAILFPTKGIKDTYLYDVEGSMDEGLTLVKVKGKEYDLEMYLDCVKRVILEVFDRYNVDIESLKGKFELEYEKLKNKLINNISEYRYKNQPELLLEDLHYFRSLKTEDRDDYQTRKLNFYKDTWCNLLNEIKFDNNSYIIKD